VTNEVKEFDTEWKRQITCPYCGYEFSDSWEYNDSNGNQIEVDCGECEKTFDMIVNVSVDYSTYKKKEV